jgi:peptide chain release factor 2|tara:strand:+ start:351 stop:1289 length:939 start_codon:yes stop_codon:yes gene_type:complete
MKNLAALNSLVNDWKTLKNEFDSYLELLDLATIENDQNLILNIQSDAVHIFNSFNEMEFQLVLSGEYDHRDALIALHAGAGGVDSQDWATMLVRMYLKWADRRNFKAQVLDTSYGEGGGIKSATIQVSGDFAYGNLKSEKGVHRLVRLSPFDSDHARHTSFVLAEILPKFEEGIDININSDDLRIDVYRAGGHGGQNVQKNSTAIRITHLPTNIVVTCQNERSQRQNRDIAMGVLTSRLMDLERKRKEDKIIEIKGEYVSAEWGNQIRSYVLHPYQMVKDHRTDLEVSNTTDVLDGDIDEFISSYLKLQLNE